MAGKNSELGERLRFALAKLGGSAKGARATGIPKRTLESWVRGERTPKAEAVAKIADATEVDLRWLITGEGGPEAPVTGEQVELVPVLEMQAPEGAPTWREEDCVRELLPLTAHFIRRLGAQPGNVRLVEMHSTREIDEKLLLRRGDWLLLDVSRRDPFTGGLFVLRPGNHLQVHLIKIDPHGEAHTVEPGGHRLTPAELKALGKTVVGRILWIMRRAG